MIARFLMLSSHVGLMATILDSSDSEHCHHCQNLYWMVKFLTIITITLVGIKIYHKYLHTGYPLFPYFSSHLFLFPQVLV